MARLSTELQRALREREEQHNARLRGQMRGAVTRIIAHGGGGASGSADGGGLEIALAESAGTADDEDADEGGLAEGGEGARRDEGEADAPPLVSFGSIVPDLEHLARTDRLEARLSTSLKAAKFVKLLKGLA